MTPSRATLDAFTAWLAARGVAGKALAVFQAGAERLLSSTTGDRVLPADVEAAALAAETAGASAEGVRNLRKIGAALMAFDRERAPATGSRPSLVYCPRCKMSHARDKNPEGCPYCRKAGFARRMRQQITDERRTKERDRALGDLAADIVLRVAAGVADAGASVVLDGELPDLAGLAGDISGDGE